MTVVSAITVLGARPDMTRAQVCAEPPRIQAAWVKWNGLRGQLQNRKMSARVRL